MVRKTANKSYYGTGRRKSSIARVWLKEGKQAFHVNGQNSSKYLKRPILQVLIEQPLSSTKLLEKFQVRCNVQGGGLAGQAGAIRLGLARALLKYDETLRSTLRRGGHLTRDPREKERKKFGRKGARRSFQFTKR